MDAAVADAPALAEEAESSDEEELKQTEPPAVAKAAAVANIGEKRRALGSLTRLEFLTDLVRARSTTMRA